MPRMGKTEEDWNGLAYERQTFLLAHRRWGTFRKEELTKCPSAAMSEEKRLPFAG